MAEQSIRTASAAAYELGECPRVDPRTGELLWVDVHVGRLHVGSYDGSAVRTRATYELGGRVSAVAPAVPDEGWLLATSRGFEHLGPHGRRLIGEVRGLLNDGVRDGRGRFWVGTISPPEAPYSGVLYRLDPDGGVHEMLRGIGASNGIGWSPDGRWMYLVDSHAKRVDVIEFDIESGALGRRQVFHRYEQGTPDGLAVAARGDVWVAVWDGWRVDRFSPDGRLIRSYRVPTARPTACCLLDPTTVLVTSAYWGLDRTEDPDAGRIFVLTFR